MNLLRSFSRRLLLASLAALALAASPAFAAELRVITSPAVAEIVRATGLDPVGAAPKAPAR